MSCMCPPLHYLHMTWWTWAVLLIEIILGKGLAPNDAVKVIWLCFPTPIDCITQPNHIYIQSDWAPSYAVDGCRKYRVGLNPNDVEGHAWGSKHLYIASHIPFVCIQSVWAFKALFIASHIPFIFIQSYLAHWYAVDGHTCLDYTVEHDTAHKVYSFWYIDFGVYRG